MPTWLLAHPRSFHRHQRWCSSQAFPNPGICSFTSALPPPSRFPGNQQSCARSQQGTAGLEQTLGAEFLQLMLPGLSQKSREERQQPPHSGHKMGLGPFLRAQPRWHLHPTDLQGLGQSFGKIFVTLQELCPPQADANTPSPAQPRIDELCRDPLPKTGHKQHLAMHNI